MKKKIIFGILAVLIFAIAFVAYKFYGPSVSTPSGEYFYIKTGSTYADVKRSLLDKKYISDGFWFDKAASALRYNTVKPGRYKITKNMSVVSLVRMLRAGNQQPLSFTITKIRYKETLASRIAKQFECDSTQMINFLTNNDSLKTFGVDTNTVMAIAMPLTYDIVWNATPRKILQHFHTAYKDFWTEERKAKAAQQGLTPMQVSILASIMDEETNKASDRGNIASVYINRLRKGIKLDADPTVIFAKRIWGVKRLLFEDLEYPSPYNTYRNVGLPPGPICTPMVVTIEAVLDAPKTEYIFFVASHEFDGSTIFTTNYDDHLKYAALYRKELSKQIAIRKEREKQKADSIAKAQQQPK
ncbi:MAG TPA: endolytic transglycosylase MltG [Chitinophagaceae bacterium]|jgi:UPF0755 protein|nr:endolytic transglycosylase MltG [Chitinophagaceae bacterium]